MELAGIGHLYENIDMADVVVVDEEGDSLIRITDVRSFDQVEQATDNLAKRYPHVQSMFENEPYVGENVFTTPFADEYKRLVQQHGREGAVNKEMTLRDYLAYLEQSARRMYR